MFLTIVAIVSRSVLMHFIHYLQFLPSDLNTIPGAIYHQSVRFSAFIMLITGASLNYSKPMMSIPTNRAVIDLTESRSPTPDVRPTPVVMDSSGRDPRISISALGQSTQSNVG